MAKPSALAASLRAMLQPSLLESTTTGRPSKRALSSYLGRPQKASTGIVLWPSMTC
jgi:hypothetical protein